MKLTSTVTGAQAFRTKNEITFYSRNSKSLNKKFPYIIEALTIFDAALEAPMTGAAFSATCKICTR
jgi:ATP-dependent DNA ligase